MQEQDGLNPADQEFEAALGSLAPTNVRVDAIAAAFAAGRRSGRRQLRIWQAAATLLLVGGSVWFAAGPHVGQMVTPVAVPQFVSRPMRTTEPFSNQSIAALQAVVNAHGLQAIPVVHIPSAEPVRADFRL